MRSAIVAGMLALSAGFAGAAYVIDLDRGAGMTVDSYWEEGGRIHLMRDGMDFNVPRERVRRIREVPDEPSAARGTDASRASKGVAPLSPPDVPSRGELDAAQRRVDRHLLRVQRERFEAKAREEPPRTLRHLEKEFRRTQQRSRDVGRLIRDADSAR